MWSSNMAASPFSCTDEIKIPHLFRHTQIISTSENLIAQIFHPLGKKYVQNYHYKELGSKDSVKFQIEKDTARTI